MRLRASQGRVRAPKARKVVQTLPDSEGTDRDSSLRRLWRWKGGPMSTASSLSRVFVVRCAAEDCESTECLFTADRRQAERTARELDWYQMAKRGWLCPHCAPPRNARKAVRT